jgi:hypothetical protein
MGSNYIIDHDTGLVSKAVVWAMGGIWFMDHWEKSDPHYWREFFAAAERDDTLHRAPTPATTEGQ